MSLYKNLVKFKTIIYLLFLFLLEIWADKYGIQVKEVARNAHVRLDCQNKSLGIYQSLFWSTDAYSNAPYSIYSVGVSDPETISAHYKNRLKRNKDAGITIYNTKVEDSGIYKCNVISLIKVNKTDGMTEHKIVVNVLAVFKLSVISPPIIIEVLPEHPKILQYTQSSLICKAKSLSPFTLMWRKVGRRTSGHYNITYTKAHEHSYQTIEVNLTISNMTRNEVGKYACVAHNIAARLSRKVKVHMQVHPKIITNHNFNANIGQTAKVNCSAIASPAPIFTWKFVTQFQPIKLHPLERHGKYFVEQTLTKKLAGNVYLMTSTLIIEGVKKDDWMMYSCVVENEVGFDQKSLDVSGYSVPDQPEILYAESLTTDVTLYWNFIYNGGKKVRQVTIEYKKSTSTQWNQIVLPRLLKQYTVKHLQALNFYDFRVKLRNGVGESIYSDVYSVKTAEKVYKKKSIKTKGKMIGPFSIATLVIICGSGLILVTCFIGMLCLYFQSREPRGNKETLKVGNRKGKKDMQQADEIEMRNMNTYSSVV